MPVEFAVVKRADVAEQIVIVGNLIGAATVEVVPRVNGRLAAVTVKLGDSVRRGQTVAKVEDLEIQERSAGQAAFRFEGNHPPERCRPEVATTNRDRSEPVRPSDCAAETLDDPGPLSGGAGPADLAKAQFEQANAG